MPSTNLALEGISGHKIGKDQVAAFLWGFMPSLENPVLSVTDQQLQVSLGAYLGQSNP